MDFIDEFYKDEDLSLLKKLTLVIPTYNRNYYLSRCLWYHAHFPYGQIILADSSPEEKKIINRQTVEKVREKFGSNILYLEYPPETEKMGGDIYRKWGDAVKHSKTEYTQIVTDKAFRFPKPLIDCIKYLDEHDEYIAVNHMKRYHLVDGVNNNLELLLATTKVNQKEYDDDSGLKRFECAIKDVWGHSALPALFRTDKLIEIYNPNTNNSINDIRYGEFQTAVSPYLLGKIYFLDNDDIASIRDIREVNKDIEKGNFKSKYSSASRYTVPNMYSYVKNNHPYYYSYRNVMIDQIVKYTELTPIDATNYFDRYLKYYLLSNYYSYPKNKILFDIYFSIPHMSAIITLLSKIIPEKHKTVIRKIIRSYNDKINNADENVNAEQIILPLQLDNPEIYQLFNTNEMGMNADDNPISYIN